MPRLIHLNGPSGVGKSTLALRLAEARPGVLDLDIDQVAALLGGWQDDFGAALEPARRLAIAMAESHLADGRDVVLPQLVTSVEQARRFEDAASRAGARYVEVALLAGADEQADRFRTKDRVSEVDRHVSRYLEERGGDEVLARIHRHHAAYLAQRPEARHLVTDGLTVEETCAALTGLLTC